VADSPFPQKDYFKNGYNGILELMEKDTALDGLMVAVDMQGLGAIRALKERGIKVPKEVKVISLTGHSIGGMLETAMTSMEVPAKEMGEEVTRMIISDIEGGPDKKNSPFHKVFEASLIERETT
jgi:LacI family transcriptional regulator